jgi:hypothetical protein
MTLATIDEAVQHAERQANRRRARKAKGKGRAKGKGKAKGKAKGRVKKEGIPSAIPQYSAIVGLDDGKYWGFIQDSSKLAMKNVDLDRGVTVLKRENQGITWKVDDSLVGNIIRRQDGSTARITSEKGNEWICSDSKPVSKDKMGTDWSVQTDRLLIWEITTHADSGPYWEDHQCAIDFKVAVPTYSDAMRLLGQYFVNECCFEFTKPISLGYAFPGTQQTARITEENQITEDDGYLGPANARHQYLDLE